MTETTTPKPVDFSKAIPDLAEMRKSPDEFIESLRSCEEPQIIAYNVGGLLEGEAEALTALLAIMSFGDQPDRMPLGVPTAWALAARLRVTERVLGSAASHLESLAPLTDEDRAKLEAL